MLAKNEGLSLQAADGVELFVTRWGPVDPLGTLVCIPGKGDHGGRYGPLAIALAAAGWQTWGLDLRGHGRSAGPRALIRRFDEYLLDVQAVLTCLAGKHPGQPVVLLGYSMGAVIATLTALQQPVAGLICLSPAFSIANRFRGASKWLLFGLSVLHPHLIVSRRYNPAAVTDDPAEQKILAADPLIDGTTRPRLVVELNRAGRECLRRAPEIRQPVLTLISPTDTIVEIAGAYQFHARLAGDRALLEYVPSRHDLLHDTQVARVCADIRTWLSRFGSG